MFLSLTESHQPRVHIKAQISSIFDNAVTEGSHIPLQPEATGVKKQMHCSEELSAFQFAAVPTTPYQAQHQGQLKVLMFVLLTYVIFLEQKNYTSDVLTMMLTKAGNKIQTNRGPYFRKIVEGIFPCWIKEYFYVFCIQTKVPLC